MSMDVVRYGRRGTGGGVTGRVEGGHGTAVSKMSIEELAEKHLLCLGDRHFLVFWQMQSCRVCVCAMSRL
jgi:hypothetical protein